LKAVIVVLVLILVLLLGREAATRFPQFTAWVQSLGMLGPVVFILAYGLAAVLLIPGFPLTMAAGALWGFAQGLVIVMLGATLGAVLAFVSARYLARGFVEAYVARSPRLVALDRAVASEGLRLVFLLRMSPLVPFNLLNYVLGVSRVRFRDYVGGMPGMIPVAAMYVYAGKVAGDLAALASGAPPRGAMYYAMLAVGLAATVAAGILTARAAQRSILVDPENIGSKQSS
jgi:uncharacterized membrane protein YdjX (TVP38/TMEM64 family)